MNWFEANNAIRDAEETLRHADTHADSMAKILCGRLRKVNRLTLARLKRELTQFNASTHEWKS